MDRAAAEFGAAFGVAFGTTASLTAAALCGAGIAVRALYRRLRPAATPTACTCNRLETR